MSFSRLAVLGLVIAGAPALAQTSHLGPQGGKVPAPLPTPSARPPASVPTTPPLNDASQLQQRLDDTTRARFLSGTRVYGGAGHMFAILADGSLWAWGLDYCEAAGVKDHTRAPKHLLDHVVRVSAGPLHALAITEDGKVWAWGSNASGQLGLGMYSSLCRAQPQVVEGFPAAEAVSASYNSSVVLARDHTVWTSGVLYMSGRYSNPYSPARIYQQRKFTAISAGDEFVLAIGEDGLLYAWGHNLSGQLGLGWAGFRGPTPQDTGIDPMPVHKLSNVRSVAAGPNGAMAVTDTGLYAWGAIGTFPFAPSSGVTGVTVNEPTLVLNQSRQPIGDVVAVMPSFVGITRGGGVVWLGNQWVYSPANLRVTPGQEGKVVMSGTFLAIGQLNGHPAVAGTGNNGTNQLLQGSAGRDSYGWFIDWVSVPLGPMQ